MDYENVLGESKFPTYEQLKSGLIRLIEEGKITREDAGMILPELRESEDERIRKALIEFLREAYSRGNAPEECAKWLVWLDWQKEQKPTSFSEPYNPDDYEVVMEGNATNLKRKEQKPAEHSVKEDKYWHGFNEGKGTVLDNPGEYGLYKSAEWSEEDEDKVAQYLHDRDGGMLWSKATEITRDILDMLRPQPKQEWSEEDENKIKDIIDYLECWNDFDHGSEPFEEYRKRMEDNIQFMKSLRPKPHWKPGEEQIGALNYAYCELFKRKDVGHNILGPLQKLCDELKKQM